MVPYPGDDNMRMIILTVLAGIGGALSYMWRETKAGKPIKFFRVALSSCLVAFICFHLGFVYKEFGLSDQMVWALNGFSAVIGVEAMMSVVTRMVFKFLKVDERDIVNQNLVDSGWTPPSNPDIYGVAKSTTGKPNSTGATEGSTPANGTAD